MDVRLLGPPAVVPRANLRPHAIEQLRSVSHGPDDDGIVAGIRARAQPPEVGVSASERAAADSERRDDRINVAHDAFGVAAIRDAAASPAQGGASAPASADTRPRATTAARHADRAPTHAVGEQEVDTRARHEHRQPAEERHGIEHHGRRTIAPRLLEGQMDLAGVGQLQALAGHGRAQDVPADLLEPLTAPGSHDLSGMEAIPLRPRDEAMGRTARADLVVGGLGEPPTPSHALRRTPNPPPTTDAAARSANAGASSPHQSRASPSSLVLSRPARRSRPATSASIVASTSSTSIRDNPRVG